MYDYHAGFCFGEVSMKKSRAGEWYEYRIIILFSLIAIAEIAVGYILLAGGYAPAVLAVSVAGLGLAFIGTVALVRRFFTSNDDILDKVENILKTTSDIDLLPGDIDGIISCLVSCVEERDAKVRTMAERLSENERLAALGELAAGVAHELNNPLAGIVVYSHLLREDTDPGDPRYANIEKIIRESNRCKNIIKSLLDFARQSEPVLEPVDVNRVIVDAFNNIRSDNACSSLRIVERYDESLPAVMADASQIQEVFENIIRNAAEILDGSGTLTVTSRPVTLEGGRTMAEIVFEDTGPGIAPEHIERVFDPFFTTKGKGHGTGLGLAVSFGIVERHHGSITAANRDEGGAAFSVRLPVREERHE